MASNLFKDEAHRAALCLPLDFFAGELAAFEGFPLREERALCEDETASA